MASGCIGRAHASLDAFKCYLYMHVELQSYPHRCESNIRYTTYCSPAAILACALFTVSLRTWMTFSGRASLKMAVPATITLLPGSRGGPFSNCFL